MTVHAEAGERTAEEFEVPLVVDAVSEDALLAVAARHHVRGHAWRMQPQASTHSGREEQVRGPPRTPGFIQQFWVSCDSAVRKRCGTRVPAAVTAQRNVRRPRNR